MDALAPGQRVVFTWRPRCGQCEFCVTGRPVMCIYGRVQARSGGLMDGTSRLRQGDETLHHFLGVSCFAEYAVTSRRVVVPLEDEIPADIAAIAGCAVVTGVGAVLNVASDGRSIAGHALLVLGAGGVGLSAVMGAHLVGADPIVVVDLAREKLDLAGRLGATAVVDASEVGPDRGGGGGPKPDWGWGGRGGRRSWQPVDDGTGLRRPATRWGSHRSRVDLCCCQRRRAH